MLVNRPGVGARLALAAILVATGLAVLPSNAAAIKTCSRLYEVPPIGDAGLGRAPLLIGDSVVGFAMPYLSELGYRIDAQGCRTFPRGITALKREARKRKLPRLIVFELGTAGDVTQAQINRVLNLIGPDRRLVLVTPRVFQGGVDPDWLDYWIAADRDPRVTVLDWAVLAEPHPEWFYGDLVHPNPQGVKEFVKLLASVLP